MLLIELPYMYIARMVITITDIAKNLFRLVNKLFQYGLLAIQLQNLILKIDNGVTILNDRNIF